MSTIFEIQSKEIENLDQIGFPDLMNHLLRAEGDRIGINQVDINTTLRINEPDAGIDARIISTPQNIVDRWIPQGQGVWQFKTGEIDTKKLKREFNKPGVQEAIKKGATYCFVVGRDYGDKSRRNREKHLEKCFKNKKLKPKYKFFTASHIAKWASEYPSLVLLPYLKRPLDGLIRFDDWANQSPHKSIDFVPDELRNQIINDVRQKIRDRTSFLFFRIEGPAGVGKTRLGMEIFREEGLKERILYASQLEDIPKEFLNWIKLNTSVECILIVDECDKGESDSLRDKAELCDKRIVLITIGKGKIKKVYSSYPEKIFSLEVLKSETIENIIKKNFPNLPYEALSFISRVTGGFVKFAMILAKGISKRKGGIDISDLLKDYEIDKLLEMTLPDKKERKGMQALSLISRIGFEGEVIEEGKKVAEFVGISWNELQEVTEKMFREGLVMKKGRYRYVTPKIIAIWLSMSVWEIRSEEIFNFINNLPNIQARKSCLERLSELGEYEKTRIVIDKMLFEEGFFFDVKSIDFEIGAEIFSYLAEASPKAGIKSLKRLIGKLSKEELLSFKNGRRYIVWTLEKLAWLPDTFYDSASLLLSLAETENESYANNATGVWTGLFKTSLGGTSVPAIERHKLIEETLNSESIDRKILAVEAIASALTFYESRSGGAEDQKGRVVPEGWRPKTIGEEINVRKSALNLLKKALNDSEEIVVKEVRKILYDSFRFLCTIGLFEETFEIIISLKLDKYEEKKEVIDILGLTLIYAENYLTESQKEKIKSFSYQLTGEDFSDRIRRWIGKSLRSDWLISTKNKEFKIEDKIVNLADEAYNNPELIEKEFDWLTSPEAVNIWYFGRQIGILDRQHKWLPKLVNKAKNCEGLLFLASYLQGCADAGESEWREELLDKWTENDKDLALAVFEATWRGQPSDKEAKRLLLLVEKGWLNATNLGIFSWGGAIKNLSIDVFIEIIKKLSKDIDTSLENALAMTIQRIENHPDEIEKLNDISWELIENSKAISNKVMISYYWKELALKYIFKDSVRIIKVILSIFEKTEDILLKHDPSIEVLKEATEIKPKEVWNLIGEFLLREDSPAHKLKLAIEKWYVKLIPTEILLKWTEKHIPNGPRIVASLIKPFGIPLDSLPREFLIKYGNDDRVKSAINSNFLSGSFWGPTSLWYEGKLKDAKEWAKDENEMVKNWAQNLVETLEKRIKEERQWEEEKNW